MQSEKLEEMDSDDYVIIDDRDGGKDITGLDPTTWSSSSHAANQITLLKSNLVPSLNIGGGVCPTGG